MATDYADLGDLKTALNIESDDTTADALLGRALTSASRSIDLTTGRRFSREEAATPSVINYRNRTLCDEHGDGQRLLVADIGTAAVTVETGPRGGPWTDITDAVELEPTDALDQGEPVTSLLYVGGRWPAGGGQRVRVTGRWGWPAVPEDITQATLLQAARLYRRKDSPEGVTGSAEWGVVRLSRRDPDVWALIEHFMVPGFG
jgi:hypothetical protein